MNYLDWIDQQIDKHQRLVAKYTLARQVLEEANKALHPPKPKPKPKQLTHSRVADDDESGETIRQAVLDELTKNGPQNSGSVIDHMGMGGDMKRKQKIYNALSQMRLAGQLDKSATGIYSIPTVHHGVAEEEQPVKLNGTR
jgi:hypothetical protein